MKKLLLLLTCCIIVISCSNDNSNAERTMPKNFINGDIIQFIHEGSDDRYAPMCLGWFYVSGPTTGQWGGTLDKEPTDEYIHPDFSSATYSYHVTGKNTASFTSHNYQALTCRSWTMDVTMIYETPNSGTYECYETCSEGLAHNIHGRFRINP